MFEQTQSVYVSVAHRYWKDQWSEARNRDVYGRSASAEGVGSNLRLEVGVNTAAEADLREPLQRLKQICDHRCFFTDFEEFRARPSTLESMTRFLAERLFHAAAPTGTSWSRLTVWETEHLGCTLTPALETYSLHERAFNISGVYEGQLDPESGLIHGGHRQIERRLRELAPQLAQPFAGETGEWGRRLFCSVQDKVKGLRELTIDLGGQQSLRISTPT